MAKNSGKSAVARSVFLQYVTTGTPHTRVRGRRSGRPRGLAWHPGQPGVGKSEPRDYATRTGMRLMPCTKFERR